MSGNVLHLESTAADTRMGIERALCLYDLIQVWRARMNLFRLIRLLRLQDSFPGRDVDVADVTVVGAPAPKPSDEIRHRQLALLERHVMATRSYRGAWRNS